MIIAGANRSGSTSLYNYLCYHPEIEGSELKQSNYFLSKTGIYRNSLAPIHYTSGLPYCEIFTATKCKYLLDASPDYLYSEGTASRISNYFPVKPKILFILREPNDRVMSWYHFGKQIGEVTKDESFEEFVNKSRSGRYSQKLSYNAVDTSYYDRYLPEFYSNFDDDDILIVYFEDIKRNALEVIREILKWLELDATPFTHYDFHSYNESKVVKSRHLYKLYKFSLIFYHNHKKHFPIILKPVIEWIKVYSKMLMFRSRSNHDLNGEYVDYSSGNSTIKDLSGRCPPWGK